MIRNLVQRLIDSIPVNKNNAYRVLTNALAHTSQQYVWGHSKGDYLATKILFSKSEELWREIKS